MCNDNKYIINYVFSMIDSEQSNITFQCKAFPRTMISSFSEENRFVLTNTFLRGLIPRKTRDSVMTFYCHRAMSWANLRRSRIGSRKRLLSRKIRQNLKVWVVSDWVFLSWRPYKLIGPDWAQFFNAWIPPNLSAQFLQGPPIWDYSWVDIAILRIRRPNRDRGWPMTDYQLAWRTID